MDHPCIRRYARVDAARASPATPVRTAQRSSHSPGRSTSAQQPPWEPTELPINEGCCIDLLRPRQIWSGGLDVADGDGGCVSACLVCCGVEVSELGVGDAARVDPERVGVGRLSRSISDLEASVLPLVAQASRVAGYWTML